MNCCVIRIHVSVAGQDSDTRASTRRQDTQFRRADRSGQPPGHGAEDCPSGVERDAGQVARRPDTTRTCAITVGRAYKLLAERDRLFSSLYIPELASCVLASQIVRA